MPKSSYQKARQYLGALLAVNRNRMSNRSFAPHPRKAIFIETSARCNLACRFCLYDKMAPGGFMDHESFLHAVDQATSLGFSFIWLTPMIGEVFADPGILHKFEALQKDPKVEGFSFYSNFIMPKAEAIAGLRQFSKLTEIHISLYGHDEESFVRTTKKPAIQFRKLLENLVALFDALEHMQTEVHFSIRTPPVQVPFLQLETPLSLLMQRFARERSAHISIADDYDDWAGTITPEDVEPLGIELSNGRGIFKHGACTRVFNEIKIKVDGSVSACAPRDVDGSLVVGNIKETSLREILSMSNPAYRKIIDDQMAGRFPDVCRSCAIYRSVFDHRPSAGDAELEVMDVEVALGLMSR